MPEYIARISKGKDSLKMVDVIITRGLPLDRVTTTDVWATDTIPAELPPVLEAKARIEEKLWQMYRIEVEHLCARNPDGTKRTYEQMFYHVPVRKSGGYRQGTILGYPDLWNPWCQAALKRNAKPQNPGNHHRIPAEHPVQLVPEAQNLRGGSTRDSRWQRELLGVRNSRPGRNQGFPAQISPWCRKLKIDKVKTPFPLARHDGQIEISWSILASLLTSLPVFDS